MPHMVNWTALVRRAGMWAGAVAMATEVSERAWATAAGPSLRRGCHSGHHWTREHHVGRRVVAGTGVVLVTLVGMSLGLLLGGRVNQDVGPFAAQFAMRPSLSGGTDVQIPPLGSLDLRSHSGPAHLSVQLQSLDRKRAEAVVTDPNGIQAASQSATADVQRGVIRVAFQSAASALLGALVV